MLLQKIRFVAPGWANTFFGRWAGGLFPRLRKASNWALGWFPLRNGGGVGHLLGGPTDTGSTDTQGPRDGNAGKKSSRSRMRGLLDWRKPRSRGRMPGSRQANGNKARQPPAQATQPRAAGPNVYGDSEFHLPPPLSTGNAQVWSHRSAAVSCPMPCSCSSAPSPVPSGPR